MAKYSITGLGESEGMREMTFTLFPGGTYLLKVQEITVNKKEDMETKEVTGNTFVVSSIVENCENLPAGIDKRDYIGKTFMDFIFVMTPEHPSYANETNGGGTVGMIGVGTLKSFLEATKNPIKGDAFNEQKSVGAYFEVSMGVRKRKDRDGNMIDANRVWSYAASEDFSKGETEEVTAVDDSFEDDLLE